MVIMAPSDENECRQMLYTGHKHQGPSAVRYPRGSGCGTEIQTDMTELEIGKGRIVKESSTKKVAILSFGTFLPEALKAAENLDASVADMRFVKPLDEELVLKLAAEHDVLVTLEENVIAGGAGSGVIELLMQRKQIKPVSQLGLPDCFVEQGTQDELYQELGLDAEGIEKKIKAYLG